MLYNTRRAPHDYNLVEINAASDSNDWMDFTFTVPARFASKALSALSGAEDRWWEDDEGCGILDFLEWALEELKIPYTVVDNVDDEEGEFV